VWEASLAALPRSFFILHFSFFNFHFFSVFCVSLWLAPVFIIVSSMPGKREGCGEVVFPNKREVAMFQRFLVVPLIGLALLGFSSGGPAQQQGGKGGKPETPFGGGKGGFKSSRLKWEYQVLTRDKIGLSGKELSAGMNKLGEEGWELVAIHPPVTIGGTKTQPEYYFKRTKGRSLLAEPKDAPPPAEDKSDVSVFRLKYAQAADVAQLLDQLLQDKGGQTLRLVAEPVTNAVLTRGSPVQLEKVKLLIERLEVLTADKVKVKKNP
jgi:hypothetical protein